MHRFIVTDSPNYLNTGEMMWTEGGHYVDTQLFKATDKVQ
jgi:hypothetical protein